MGDVFYWRGPFSSAHGQYALSWVFIMTIALTTEPVIAFTDSMDLHLR